MDPPKRPWLSFPVSPLNLIFLALLLGASPTFAASSISANRSLSGDQTLTSSPTGNFVLGFFSPTRGAGPRKFYIGIWYGKVSQSQKTVVWVANREAPVSDPSTSELRIAGDGNLVLLDRSGALVWSTNAATSVASNSTVAELLDGGNLVLRDGSNSSGRSVFWQSIDNPTDHWLPGGKLGLNKVTGKNQRLTSWKNSEDPAPGIFSLEIDPDGVSEYLIRWNQSRVFWRSGTWNGRIFSNVPEMTSNYVYDFRYVTDERENYFTYTMKPGATLVSRFVMDLSGQIKQLTWLDNTGQWILFWSQPRAQCDVYMLCGPFDACNERSLPFYSCLRGFSEASLVSWNPSDLTGGCARHTPLLCTRNGTSVHGGDQDRFYGGRGGPGVGASVEAAVQDAARGGRYPRPLQVRRPASGDPELLREARRRRLRLRVQGHHAGLHPCRRQEARGHPPGGEAVQDGGEHHQDRPARQPGPPPRVLFRRHEEAARLRLHSEGFPGHRPARGWLAGGGLADEPSSLLLQ